MLIIIFLFLLESVEASKYPISAKEIVSLRSNIFNRLDQCTTWRHSEKNLKNEADVLDVLLFSSKFGDFKNAAIDIAEEKFPETIDCLDRVTHDVEEYQKLVKVGFNNPSKPLLSDFLTPDQIHQLHTVLQKTQRKDLIEKGLFQHFHGISEKQRNDLLTEFFTSKPREKRSVNNDPESVADEPVPLNPEWLSWQSARQKYAVERLKSKSSSNWEVMHLIADQFYHLRKSVRKLYEKQFLDYCNDNIQSIIGNESFALLGNMYNESDHTEHIKNQYQKIIVNLENETDRLTADHYGHFCRKIYRLVQFEQADLMSWLSAKQKLQIADMIQDQNVNDFQVYEKLYEFFNQTAGDQKEAADEVITLGCRKFISHHFGDQISEEIEEMRVSKNVSSQYIAAILAMKHRDLELDEESVNKKRIDESLSICKRIYLDYNGSCNCNGNSETCDPLTHTCEFCQHNTKGHFCETCIEKFTKNSTTGKCEQNEEPKCNCNGHSSTCTAEGTCTNCDNHTIGDFCEICATGYYGDATLQPTCTKCPCPKDAECSLAKDGHIECPDCPEGHIGLNCEIKRDDQITTTTVHPISTTLLNENQL